MNRVKVEKTRDYTTINNTCVKDATLSLKAKGLLLTVMSLPEDWDFSVRGIIKIVKEEKTAVYNIIKELRDHGYCKLDVVRENNRIAGYDYTFYEKPQADLLVPEKLEVEIMDTENQHPENVPQLSKEEINSLSNEIPNLITHTNELVREFPLSVLYEAFPHLELTPSKAGLIEAAVKKGDETAWAATIQIYVENCDYEKNRYLPDKIGNLLSVFRTQKAKLTKGEKQNEQTKPKYPVKTTNAEVFSESADYYAEWERRDNEANGTVET